MKLYLGVDGGQSRTRAAIGDETGRVLAFGDGPPSNHVAAEQGRERLLRALNGAVGGVCLRLGLEMADTRFEAAFLGFTGGEIDKRPIVEELIHAKWMGMSEDSAIALTGALNGEPGIVTIAGTGSISFGRNRQGQAARAGGWGFSFGDEGSAYDLTRQALRAALRFEEGWGPATVLHDMLREAVGLDDIRLVQRKLYSAEYPRDRVAGLSHLVDEAARLNDPVARQILTTAAGQLVTITQAVRARIFEPREPVVAGCAGGVFRCDILRLEFVRLWITTGLNLVTRAIHEPVIGALIEAYRVGGITLNSCDPP